MSNADYIDMSLDDIIKLERKKGRGSSSGARGGRRGRGGGRGVRGDGRRERFQRGRRGGGGFRGGRGFNQNRSPRGKTYTNSNYQGSGYGFNQNRRGRGGQRGRGNRSRSFNRGYRNQGRFQGYREYNEGRVNNYSSPKRGQKTWKQNNQQTAKISSRGQLRRRGLVSRGRGRLNAQGSGGFNTQGRTQSIRRGAQSRGKGFQIRGRNTQNRGRGRVNQSAKGANLVRTLATKRLQKARKSFSLVVSNRRALARQKLLNIKRGLVTDNPRSRRLKPGLIVGGLRADVLIEAKRKLEIAQRRLERANITRGRRKWGRSFRGQPVSPTRLQRSISNSTMRSPPRIQRRLDRSTFHQLRLDPVLQTEIAMLQRKPYVMSGQDISPEPRISHSRSIVSQRYGPDTGSDRSMTYFV